jgi:mannose-6-phosphate isomerase-like protein (cupin superfamily)
MERRNFVRNSLFFSAFGFTNFTLAKKVTRPKKGIKVASGTDRFQKSLKIGNAILDCKVSGKDTDSDLYIFESLNNLKNEGPPLHLHPDLDETFYILGGSMKFKVGDEIFYLKAGDSIFVPRNMPHAFTSNSDKPSKMLIIVQSATTMEAFFEELSKIEKITPEIAAKIYQKHNMVLLGPPLFAD